eukprot:c4276_g1_i2.p1 GENE.c4276_g1_i2~~c4276_g1_i2.p1  ORF type:complete len:418 (-),score=66.39 c4276_g1_i2:88-1341(-)
MGCFATDDVTCRFALDRDTCGILLLGNQWNPHRLSENWWTDSARLCAKAGVLVGKTAVVPAGGQALCLVCYQTRDAQREMYALGCDHWFCLDCWAQYMALAVKTKDGLLVRCMSEDCPVRLTERDVARVGPAAVLETWQRYFLESYVDKSNRVKWCPNPRSCTYVCIYEGRDAAEVACTCGYTWCFKCSLEGHKPATCEAVEEWNAKYASTKEVSQWLIANTKPCPKCRVHIEKNHGCMHMTCSQCRFEFCWLCRGPWSEHGSATGGFYSCNRYDDSKARAEDSKSAMVKESHDRYLHFFDRFFNHDRSQRIALERLPGGSQAEAAASTDYMDKAKELVLRCRRVLKWTYVTAFYMPAGEERNLFEFLQQDLEKSTEHLTGLTEAATPDVHHTRNYTRVTASFLQNLLSGIERGLTA